MKRIIITGATGMVGKSILLEAIEDTRIAEILLISRKSVNLSHSKIKELLLEDYEQLPEHHSQLINYDACFHCMGVSAVGMEDDQYHYITFELTKVLVDTLYYANPDMTISYVSGAGTDSTEKGRVMWARVKGKTENMILNKGFKKAFMIRLGAILPEKGIKSRTGWYNLIYTITRPLFPLMKTSKNIITTTQFGKSMLSLLFKTPNGIYLKNRDLNNLNE